MILGLTLLLAPAAARAGWYAKQTNSAVGGPGNQTSELFYQDKKLRVDGSDKTSVVIDLDTGNFTYVDHGKKQWATTTVQELVAMRDAMLAQMKAQLPNMPPEVRKQVEAQLAQIEQANKKQDLDFKKLGTKDTVNGFACDNYTWKGADGSGEACIATKLPVDMSEFQKASSKLGEKLSQLGGGGAGSLAMLKLSEHGFPIRTKRLMQMGPQTAELTSVVTAIEARKLAASDFAAPTGYQKIDFSQMTAGAGGPPR